MKINKKLEGNNLEFALEGRLDTTTAPSLEEEVKNSIEGIKELVFDLKDLVYVSSAGLRVLLSAQKTMNKQGNMIIRNANEEVMEIFEVTGFIDILNIEE
ncbi:MAG: STAS domain-containing protein [Lachnospiraceae bacterium]|nr:STAS domain-containing protein [Lachnospiraceae bacterium]MBQ4276033.1 STAS domain-containing protein [Lachnospiraceae bacterium]